MGWGGGVGKQVIWGFFRCSPLHEIFRRIETALPRILLAGVYPNFRSFSFTGKLTDCGFQ